LYGNVETHQVELGFRVAGRIADMLAEEGSAVQAGDVIARLDTGPLEDELRIARANVAMQEANLAKAEAGYREEEIAQARAVREERETTAGNLRLNVERLRTLREHGGISQQALEDAQARYHEALSRLEAARKQLAMLETGFRPEDIAVQRAALELARANQAKVQTALDDAGLHAPATGVILTKARERGAIVQAGQTVYTLTLNRPVHIRAYVPQPKLGLIRPGAPVTLEIDAVPGKSYRGTVGYISSAAEFTPKSVETGEVRNDLVFRIRILADDPDDVMRQGMPVTITMPVPSF
jgi:HlyD family secretion protein